MWVKIHLIQKKPQLKNWGFFNTNQTITYFMKCPEQESNLHSEDRNMALNHARLPIPPSGLFLGLQIYLFFSFYK